MYWIRNHRKEVIMNKAIILACTLALSIAFCSNLPFLGGRPEDEQIPDSTVPTPAEVDRLPLPETPLVPGINPEMILAHFAEQDRMVCGGWYPFWNVWEGYCYTPAPPYPAYSVHVYGRTGDTVDNIQAAVDQREDADIEVIVSFFEEVLTLPYEGAAPETILAWVRAELSGAEPDQFLDAVMTHNGIPYTLSGFLTYAISLDIGTIEPFIEMP
jgi:hypothetical protein